ncbi:rhomboid family intramembrane serine protease [Spirochaeta cellobiosiphila]|uniref:rhomboid family intramembrane serine protease n=1 Tax=Spirochaeta cellobiosiphila TaxID=504483 RepID=UPI00048A91FA|nr:rhomboid family intramembrane serine protease [Spirochaeta cellobiosiphila]
MFLQKKLPYSRHNVVLYLIGINVVVFFLTSLSRQFQLSMAMTPIAVIEYGYYWQLVTYMFTHASFSHILFNMLALFIFGQHLEERLGSWEFLLYYMFVGILVGLISLAFYWYTGSPQVSLLGASGAIYGVMLGFATFYPTARIFIWGLIPVRAPILVLGYTVIEVYSQLASYNSNVAHFSHLAGFLFAYLYFLVRLRINPIDRFFPPKRYR